MLEINWRAEYEKAGALWIHDGNINRPHAELTSGKHSNGFFNSEFIMENPANLDKGIWELLSGLRGQAGDDVLKLNRVVGPAMGAITMAHAMARNIAESFAITCLRSYAEKQEDDTMAFRRTRVLPGDSVLLVEDVLTTGGSVEKVLTAVQSCGGVPIPYVAVLVNRSGLKEVAGLKVISLVEETMTNWLASECPLCKQGSKAIRPKGENWALLTAEY